MRITRVMSIVALVVLAVVAHSGVELRRLQHALRSELPGDSARALGPRVRHSISSPRCQEPGCLFLRRSGQNHARTSRTTARPVTRMMAADKPRSVAISIPKRRTCGCLRDAAPHRRRDLTGSSENGVRLTGMPAWGPAAAATTPTLGSSCISFGNINELDR